MGISTTDVWMIIRARDEASRAIHALGRSFGSLDKDAIAAANKQLDRGRALSTMGAGLVATGAAGFLALEKLGAGARAYDQQAAATLTQTDNINASLKDLKKIGLDVAKAIPVAFEEIQPAMYDIFSSIDVNVPQARKLIMQFAKDAVAGNTDLSTATRVNLQLMNAYGIKVKDVSKVSDFMFQLVRKGVGTYQDMAGAIGKSIPSAAKAGQTYKELGGMIAFMTRNGLSAAQAGTSAARALDAISNPGTVKKLKEMGINVLDANGNFKDMTVIVGMIERKLQGLNGEAAKAAALKDIFGGSGGTIQAMRFFNLATKNTNKLREYKKLTDDMKRSGGAAGGAFDIMSKTDQAKQQQAINNLKAFGTQLGDIYNVIRSKVLVVLGELANWFTNLPQSAKKTIVYFVLISSTLAVLIGVGLILAGMFLIVEGAAAAMGIGILALSGIFIGIIAAIALVGAAAYLIYKNWDKVGPWLNNVWQMIKNGAITAWHAVTDVVLKAFNAMKPKLSDFVDDVKALWAQVQPFLKALGIAFTFAGKYIVIALQFIARYLPGFVATLMPMVNGVLAVFKGLFDAAMSVINGFIQTVTGVLMILRGIFTGNFSLIKAGVLQILTGMWTTISGVFVAGFNMVVGILKSWYDTVIGFFKHLYDVLVGHSIVPDLINAIVKWFRSLPGKVLGVLSGFIGSIISFFSRMMVSAANAVGAGIKGIVSKAKQIGSSIKDGISELPGQLYDLGVHAIQGFINGMGHMVSAVASKAKDIAKGAAGAIAHGLGIKSPSRVLFALGKYTTMGFVNGMISQLKSVKKAASSISEAAQVNSSGTYQISGGSNPGNGGMPPGYTPPVDPGNGGGGKVFYQDVTVNTQEIDPRKHAADLGFELFQRVS